MDALKLLAGFFATVVVMALLMVINTFVGALFFGESSAVLGSPVGPAVFLAGPAILLASSAFAEPVSRRLGVGALAVLAVALPWYVFLFLWIGTGLAAQTGEGLRMFVTMAFGILLMIGSTYLALRGLPSLRLEKKRSAPPPDIRRFERISLGGILVGVLNGAMNYPANLGQAKTQLLAIPGFPLSPELFVTLTTVLGFALAVTNVLLVSRLGIKSMRSLLLLFFVIGAPFLLFSLRQPSFSVAAAILAWSIQACGLYFAYRPAAGAWLTQKAAPTA